MVRQALRLAIRLTFLHHKIMENASLPRSAHLALWIGLLLPIVLIVITFIILQVGRNFVHPSHDFVYLISGDYTDGSFSVTDNRITYTCYPSRLPIAYDPANPSTSQPSPEPSTGVACNPHSGENLYIYHVKTDTSDTITYADAKKLTVDGNAISRDHYTISNASSRSIGVLGDTAYNPMLWYIGRATGSKKLNLSSTFTSSNDHFQFLGWIN